jgi:enoyl-CoA hydratase/carnithine racemase
MSGPADPFPLAHLDTIADGLSPAQVSAIWRAVAEARAGRFDALAAHAQLIAAGYTALETEALVEEMVERLAERQPMT